MPILNGKLKGMLWPIKSNYLFIYGNYEHPNVLKWFDDNLDSESVFYDLGANHGYYSFYASKTINKGKIYAFEPIGEHYETMVNIAKVNEECTNKLF